VRSRTDVRYANIANPRAPGQPRGNAASSAVDRAVLPTTVLGWMPPTDSTKLGGGGIAEI